MWILVLFVSLLNVRQLDTQFAFAVHISELHKKSQIEDCQRLKLDPIQALIEFTYRPLVTTSCRCAHPTKLSLRLQGIEEPLLESAVNCRPPAVGPVGRSEEDVAVPTLKLLLVLGQEAWLPPSRACLGIRIGVPIVKYLCILSMAVWQGGNSTNHAPDLHRVKPLESGDDLVGVFLWHEVGSLVRPKRDNVSVAIG